MRKLTNEQCIEKLKSLYGDIFNYSKVDYQGSRSNITLICPKHGEFTVYGNNALQGRANCPKCRLNFLDKDDFINKARALHGNKYIYDEVEYINASTPVKVICPEHGAFYPTPRHHAIEGTGCSKCRKRKSTKQIIKKSTEELNKERLTKWIQKSSELHNNKYDYSLVTKLEKLQDKVSIICPIHGIFIQMAGAHSGKQARECPKCARSLVGDKNKISQEEFEKRAREVHGKIYSYGKYNGMHHYIEVNCPKHGIFKVTPHNHLNGCGCPTCSSSTGENFIRGYLENNNIKYKSQYRINLKKEIKTIKLLVADFLVKYNNQLYIIEYNGRQHYEYIPFFHKGGKSEFNRQKIRDSVMKKICEKNNIKLIEISYLLSKDDIYNLLNNIFYENEEQIKKARS